MRKCYQCRKITSEMDTVWERIRQWFFRKFHEDIIDLSQDKYTQGFGDGYKKGWDGNEELAKKTRDALMEEIRDLQQKPNKLARVEAEHILTIEKAGGRVVKVLLGKKEVPLTQLQELKAEAGIWQRSALWKVFQETLKDRAYQTMFEKSESFDDMKTGKMMLYNLDVQKNIVDMLLSIEVKSKS